MQLIGRIIMESSQVNFFMHPEDIELFGKYLAENNIISINQPQFTAELKFSSSIAEKADNEWWLKCFLVREADISFIKNEFIKKQNYYLINEFESPVIEFSRCFFDGKILKHGRLYFLKAVYDSNGKLVYKSQEFITRSHAVLKWIKKYYKRDIETGYYFSPRAEEWKNNSGKLDYY